MAKDKAKKINKAVLKLPVKFKNLSVGDTTTSIGVTVARSHGKLNLVAAEEAFCGKRLKVCLLVGAGSDPDQGVLWDDAQFRIDAIADAKKVSITPKLIGTSLQFQLSGVNIEELTHFANQEGVLLVVKVVDIPAEDQASDAAMDKDEDEEEDDKKSEE